MRILGTGIDYSTGEVLIDSIDEETFGQTIEASLARNADQLRSTARTRARGAAVRGEVERERTVDLGDPKAAGWIFVVNRDDPRRADIERALAPLAEHREMSEPSPLVFNGEPEEEWQDWMQEHYLQLELDGKKVPHYVLIAGSPEQVPFQFQALLDSAASVGRVDFDTIKDLEAYVDKVLRYERASAPTAAREALFFATDGGPGDATHFSRRFMADPLAKHVSKTRRFPTRAVIAEDATKARFLDEARQRRPALVYAATHGMAAPKERLEIQKRVNGGICCGHETGDAKVDWLITAEDVDAGQPFLEGSVVVQFACFGYGTPAESDFRHWLGGAGLNSAASFVAALPKKLLSHPRGPIAFIGHVDTAWLHGFDDPESPYQNNLWNARIMPYKKAIEVLLKCQPVALAMSDLNKRFDYANAQLTLVFDKMVRRKLALTPAQRKQLANSFIFRSDAQNYLVFGDPAAHLRIPAA